MLPWMDDIKILEVTESSPVSEVCESGVFLNRELSEGDLENRAANFPLHLALDENTQQEVREVKTR